jgi:hypothetical protein
MIARGSLIVAIVVSAAVVLSAPFVGQIRAALRAAFPGRFVAIVGGGVAIAGRPRSVRTRSVGPPETRNRT